MTNLTSDKTDILSLSLKYTWLWPHFCARHHGAISNFVTNTSGRIYKELSSKQKVDLWDILLRFSEKELFVPIYQKRPSECNIKWGLFGGLQRSALRPIFASSLHVRVNCTLITAPRSRPERKFSAPRSVLFFHHRSMLQPHFTLALHAPGPPPEQPPVNYPSQWHDEFYTVTLWGKNAHRAASM